MSRMMVENDQKRKLRILLISLAAIGLVFTVVFVSWVANLNTTVKNKMAGKRWSAPTEFYSAPPRFYIGQANLDQNLTEALERLGYQRLALTRDLQKGEFTRWTPEICREKVPAEGFVSDNLSHCWGVMPLDRLDSTGAPDKPKERPLQIYFVGLDGKALGFFEGATQKTLELEPELLSQFYGDEPILRQVVTLGDVSPQVLNAILAIEDKEFLTHKGISITGMGRAALRNLLRGRKGEGGSTITQQLVKNYFLTPEKTFRRKFTEIVMSLILESQVSKDDILETYINEVYLGQEGPFQIHGVAMGAKFLFNKKPDELSLAESALLAGVIQAPNMHNPFRNPERATARRNLVLKKMLDLNLIDPAEFQQASTEPLPSAKLKVLKDLAPFYIDAVKLALKEQGIQTSEGLRVFTTLNLKAQRAATEAVMAGVINIEKQYVFIQKQEKKFNTKLQGALISADVQSGFVEAVVGGRSYGETQLNRTLQSKRQVGSIFKPFVYAAAFSANDKEGKPFTPLTPVDDEIFTIKYEGQQWSPQNYDDKYEGHIPMYRGLQNSLNAATAQVAQTVGLKNIADLARSMGLTSPIAAVPSISLGSMEFSPFEVLQSYSTFARGGVYQPLTFFYLIMDADGKVIYQYEPVKEQALDPVENAETVNIMEKVMDFGTGRGIRAAGFTMPAAGKTGTTSDTKDAWFGGYTPLHAAVVWVGFDIPEKMGLTGGLAAAPIWGNYMKAYATTLPAEKFVIPEGAVELEVDPATGELASAKCPEKVKLVFKKGNEPTSNCITHQ